MDGLLAGHAEENVDKTEQFAYHLLQTPTTIIKMPKSIAVQTEQSQSENLMDFDAIENEKCCSYKYRNALFALLFLTFMVELLSLGTPSNGRLLVQFIVSLFINVMFCASGLYGLLFNKHKAMVVCLYFCVCQFVWSILANIVIIKYNAMRINENGEPNLQRGILDKFVVICVLQIVLNLWVMQHLNNVVQTMKSYTRASL